MDIEPKDYIRFLEVYLKKTTPEVVAFELNDLGQGEERYAIVLDIGCGSNGGAAAYDSVLNVGHIYAIDINEKMIEYSKHNHSKAGVTYFVQDFAAEFDSMAPELRALEGRVDLIVTLYCLQYICDEERVADNMSRLLAKGGKVCATIVCLADPYGELTGADKERHEREWMKVPTIDAQRNQWLNAFKRVGFRVIVDKYLSFNYHLTQAHFEQSWIPLHLTNYRRYYVHERDVKAMDRRLEAKVTSLANRYTEEPTGAIMFTGRDTSLRLVLQK